MHRSASRPVYVLGGADPRASALLPDVEPVTVASAAELLDRVPGLLLLPVDRLPAEEVVAAMRIAAGPPKGGDSEPGDWLPVWLEGDPSVPRATPVSLGWPAAPRELARWAAGSDEADVLELRHVLVRIGRGRHDLNNPLTSAMAETQLALMDVNDPQAREGLQTVEEQLRRMRDLIAALRVLRRPS